MAFWGNVDERRREKGVRATEMGRLWEGSDASLCWVTAGRQL